MLDVAVGSKTGAGASTTRAGESIAEAADCDDDM